MPEFDLTSFGLTDKIQEGNGEISVSFEVTSILGEGQYNSSHVNIPLKLDAQKYYKDRSLTLTPLEMISYLYYGTPSGNPPSVDTLLSQGRQIIPPRLSQVYLRFPLSPRNVECIEEFRNGKDLILSISLLVMLKVADSENQFIGTDYAQTRDTVRFTIHRSHWVDYILPKLGYLTKYILEIDVPATDELRQPFEKAIKEFSDAQAAFLRDDYSGVLVNCRNTIDALVSTFHLDLGDQKPSFANRAKAFGRQFIQPRLNSETKTDLIIKELLALWPLLSAETKPGLFQADRFIAKYVLQDIANLLTYLGKVFNT
jgi:hypothetical protein